jgi:hypothetical protein
MAEISRGQVNLNTVLGAIGTYGAVGGGNLLGGLFGGGGNNCGCSEDHVINRYEAAQNAKISELETEIKLRDANFYTIGEIDKLRSYVDNRFTAVEHEICDQRVYNATANATISCIQGQVAQLMGLTKTVIPNGSICPGWGNVTITPATTAPTT